VYRCFHCRDLHVSADQARACSRSDDIWFAAALVEVDRILKRGPIPWTIKRSLRDGASWTLSERRLLKALETALPEEAVLPQWWIPGCDYRVDVFLPSMSLAVEVDGASHQQRSGADRLRSSVLRSHGITIVRVPNEMAMSGAEHVARTIAQRMLADDRLPLELAESA
jgi:very-short-patch-repair endonuclease